MCAFSLLSWMKLFPHTLHLNGFSPVVNPAPHVSHVNIFPLWTDWCVRSDRLFTKALPQTAHLYGCSVKAYLKLSPHSEHLCGFSTVCTTW
uniref:Secreted protein n=1 Tax=Amphiprion percula TaxID=161767 RepID=A0A3P8THL2_AMPPE